MAWKDATARAAVAEGSTLPRTLPAESLEEISP